MRTAIFAIALMTSAAAMAQTYPDATMTPPPADMGVAPNATDPMTTTAWMSTAPSTGQVQAADNTHTERDARGIAVISDPAMVPAGYNGTAATGVGGPLVDPATGTAMTMTDTAHPPCTAAVTDNCVQTYERGRAPR